MNFGKFVVGFAVLVADFVSTKFATDDFKTKVKFFGKFENHKATAENCNISSVAVGIGVFFFNVGISLDEIDIFVIGDY